MDEINKVSGMNEGLSSTPSKADRNQSSRQGSSAFASEMNAALGNLSNLDSDGKLREDAILNAKAIIKNWTPPTDSQISTILENMRDQLLA